MPQMNTKEASNSHFITICSISPPPPHLKYQTKIYYQAYPVVRQMAPHFIKLVKCIKKEKKNFNPTSEEKAEGKRIMYSTYFQRRFTNEKKSDRKDIKQERLQQQHVQYCSPAPSSLPADISPFSPYAFSPRLLSVPSFILALVYSHSIVYPFPPLFFFPFHSRDCILFLTFFPCLFPSYPLLSSPLLYIPLDPCHDTVKKI